MKLLILTTLSVFSLTAYSQSNVVRDTTTTNMGELSISYTITGDLSTYTSVTIQEFDVVNGDTISIFEGSYDLDEDDPSSFSRFEYDEANSQLMFGIGSYEPGAFHSIITIHKLTGLPEEFTIN